MFVVGVVVLVVFDVLIHTHHPSCENHQKQQQREGQQRVYEQERQNPMEARYHCVWRVECVLWVWVHVWWV